jgi:hypothetical protein
MAANGSALTRQLYQVQKAVVNDGVSIHACQAWQRNHFPLPCPSSALEHAVPPAKGKENCGLERLGGGIG